MPDATTPLRPGDIVRIRGERWSVVRQTTGVGAGITEVVGCETSNRAVRARFLVPFETIDRLSVTTLPRLVRQGRWRRAARGFLSRATPSLTCLQAAVGARLDVLPFQLEPALAVTRGVGARLLIADAVGLGKTVQAGLIVSELLERGTEAHAIVVVPSGLRAQWRRELEERFRIRASVIDSASLAHASGAGWDRNPWSATPVVITSIDYVKRPETIRALEGIVWDVVVFDEAHALSGRSDRAAAAALLAERGRTVVMLSATPHSGDTAAFERLCGIGDLGQRFPLLVFRRTRETAGVNIARRTTWLRVRPTSAELDLHRELMAYARLVWHQQGPRASGARLAATVLLRRACSGAAALARSVARRLELLDPGTNEGCQLEFPFALDDAALDEEPAALLAAPGMEDSREERRRLQQVLELAMRVDGGESKLAALERLLRRTSEPLLVFTEYRDSLIHVAARFPDEPVAVVHGGLTASERAEAIEAFTAGGARLLLATDAASEGLNLQQRCRTVVNLELPWTPTRLEQRVGRVERIGQRRRVHAMHLVAAGTAEELTVARLHRRMSRIAAAFNRVPRTLREDEMARAVLAGTEPALSHTAAVSSSSRVIFPDLRRAAAAESRRIVIARRLGGDSLITSRERPLVTLTRRQAVPEWFCAVFRVECVDADGQLLWEHVFGMTGRARHPALWTSVAVRRWAPSFMRAARSRALRESERAVVRFAQDARRVVMLSTGREQAILQAVQAQRSHLALPLLQPGLFGDSVLRATAARTQVFDEAVGRSRARLARLARAATCAAGEPDLCFLVIAR